MKTKSMIWFYSIVIFGLLIINTSCKKDNQEDAIKDIDGNIYTAITIGSQVWMVENLKTTHYNDGTVIPNITDDDTWKNQSEDAYCNYDNLESNVPSNGRLYNWHAVHTGKLAPKGWHIATKAEWITLFDYLENNGYAFEGNGDDIAKSLASDSGWQENTSIPGSIGYDQMGNNESGFTAVPSGFRFSDGTFQSKRYAAEFWSSTEHDLTYAIGFQLAYSMSIINEQVHLKTCGCAVRCLKD